MKRWEMFERLIRALKTIPTADIDEVVAERGFSDDADDRDLRVMISSPHHGFEDERKALDEALKPFATLETRLFEKIPDSGATNVAESVRLVDQCDLFVALFDPSHEGSEIPQAQRPPGYDARYFSELEIECALRKQRKGGWPLIFIYERLLDPPQPATATSWHAPYRTMIAPKPYTSVDELVTKVQFDLLGNVIEIRSSRAHVLSKKLANVEREFAATEARLKLELAEAKAVSQRALSDATTAFQRDLSAAQLSGQLAADAQTMLTSQVNDLTNEIESQRKSLTESHTRTINALHEDRDRVIGQLTSERVRLAQENHDERARLRCDHMEEMKDLHTRLRQGEMRTATAMVRGAAIGTIPLLVLILSLMAWFGRDDIAGSIDQAGRLVASATGYQPVHVSSTATDPMLLSAKIELARLLTDGMFDCNRRDKRVAVSGWPSTNLFVVRDNACSSVGPFLLEGDGAESESCDYDPLAKSDWWKHFLAKTRETKDGRLAIKKITLIGHASEEKILSRCLKRAPDWLPIGHRAEVRDLDLADLDIQTNVQLAYVRARVVQREIEKAGGDPPLPFKMSSETMGILQPAEGEESARRVSIAIDLSGRSDEQVEGDTPVTALAPR